MSGDLYRSFSMQQLRRRWKNSALSDSIAAENGRKIEGSDSGSRRVRSSNAITWGLLWSLVACQKFRLTVSIIAIIGCTICSISFPIYSGNFLLLLTGEKQGPQWKLPINVGILYILDPVFTSIYVVNMNTIWEKVISSIRVQMFQKMLIQKVEFFDRYKVGELTALLASDLSSLQNIASDNIARERGFRALFEVVGTICLLFILSPQLASILGLLILTMSVSVAVYKQSTVPAFKAHHLAQASIANCATETFSGIRTVRSFGGEKRQMSMFISQVLACQTSGIKLGTFKSINETVSRVVVYISLISTYYLGRSKVHSGEHSIETIMAFTGCTIPLTVSIQGLVNTFRDLRGAFAAIERINSVLSDAFIDGALACAVDREIKQDKLYAKYFDLVFLNGFDEKNQNLNVPCMPTWNSASNILSLAWCGDICLEDAHFSYPLRPDVEVLNGLNLELRCGTFTALVGSSGVGKSTTVQLLARFYEPNRGQITIAGEDVLKCDKSEWARAVSIVNQIEPFLFSASIGENIAYGLPDDHATKDAVIKAAKAANAHNFIVSLPETYDTLVGEHGGLLSGGQKQRIAIARALLKNAPILILDEATSALDSINERLIQDSLNHLMKGRTTLVIGHRLSTVQDAHQIALCSGGKIAEIGTHVELLNRNGEYASLIGSQNTALL